MSHEKGRKVPVWFDLRNAKTGMTPKELDHFENYYADPICNCPVHHIGTNDATGRLHQDQRLLTQAHDSKCSWVRYEKDRGFKQFCHFVNIVFALKYSRVSHTPEAKQMSQPISNNIAIPGNPQCQQESTQQVPHQSNGTLNVSSYEEEDSDSCDSIFGSDSGHFDADQPVFDEIEEITHMEGVTEPQQDMDGIVSDTDVLENDTISRHTGNRTLGNGQVLSQRGSASQILGRNNSTSLSGCKETKAKSTFPNV